jgi:hypothetical protein
MDLAAVVAVERFEGGAFEPSPHAARVSVDLDGGQGAARGGCAVLLGQERSRHEEAAGRGLTHPELRTAQIPVYDACLRELGGDPIAAL